MAPDSFLRRVAIRNFKSIGQADVTLGQLTVLVGRNGSGKSNFLDALDFVADSLKGYLSNAIKWRGGIEALLHQRGSGHAPSFAIELDIDLAEQGRSIYRLELEVRERSGFGIRRESLTIHSAEGLPENYYNIESVDGGVTVYSSVDNMPPAFPDRLYLTNAAGFSPFRATFDFLSSIGSYNLNPEAMRNLQLPDPGDLLREDGGNAASVIARLSADQPQVLERINAYLAAIVPEYRKVERISLGPRETLLFTLGAVDAEHPLTFLAASMSDGTLRALGALVAVFQATGKVPVSLIGIEEPENSLHPAAAAALMDALREAASRTQILVTSHSPDLLEQVDLEADRLLAVVFRNGETLIAPVDQASRRAVRDNLYTPGELLRLDQFEPDSRDLQRQGQIQIFPDEE